MQLKEYQRSTLDDLRRFMARVAELRDLNERYPSQAAFEEMSASRMTRYNDLRDERGSDVPFVCIQRPTGGGKTLLASHTVDIANQHLTKRKTGLVLWVVPTTQIYRQTLRSLDTKDHPYREVLDRSSGGRTLILEKDASFTPSQVEENLVVLMLMMQSSSRVTKDTLRFYRASGFDAFFPSEDRLDEHERILRLVPNLDVYNPGAEQRQIIPSLGNVVRRLEPLVILDEGHKAKSTIQRDTLIRFNPRAIVEFTATPHPTSNVLVNIKGSALLREEMIKLPLRVTNIGTADWKDALAAAVQRREELEKAAGRLRGSTDEYIRPICVIQVERTGKDQRQRNFIHAEDVKEELFLKRGVAPNEIAIQSSEKKELNEFEDANGLLTKNNSIRYIITKDALKEGWDCSFAYVLCLLNTPQSKTGATQLVGRILRQPYAKKTRIPQLNESYVVSFKQNKILDAIKEGFDDEGLADLKRQIEFDDGRRSDGSEKSNMNLGRVRSEFKNAIKHFILPTFVIRTPTKTRPVDYEADIESRIDWNRFSYSQFLHRFQFSDQVIEASEDSITLGEEDDILETFSRSGDIVNTFHQATPEYLAQEIMDIVPNPWMAYELGKQVLEECLKREHPERVRNNLYRIAASLRTFLREEKDILAREVFKQLLDEDTIRFVFFTDTWKRPDRKEYSEKSRVLTHLESPYRGEKAQRSLFDAVSIVEDDFDNSDEQNVALWLDRQEMLLYWYRNMVGKDWYFLQGWRPNKIYPDFVSTGVDPSKKNDFDRVFVIETKGDHLQAAKLHNTFDKTGYIEQLFALCNDARPRHLNELGLEMESRPIKFQLIHYNDTEYQNQIAALFET